MIVIWKYEFEVKDFVDIKMPKDSQILSVQDQNGVACLWVLINTKRPETIRKFRIFGTGNSLPVNEDIHKYIGTFQTKQGLLVWHLFECGNKALNNSNIVSIFKNRLN